MHAALQIPTATCCLANDVARVSGGTGDPAADETSDPEAASPMVSTYEGRLLGTSIKKTRSAGGRSTGVGGDRCLNTGIRRQVPGRWLPASAAVRLKRSPRAVCAVMLPSRGGLEVARI